MKPFVRYLWILSAFALILGVVYFLITTEWTGTVLLLALATMPLIVGLWLARHHQVTVDGDDPDGDPAALRGQEVGVFPSVTAWPFFFVLGLIIVGAGLIYGLILIPGGLILVGVAVVGLMKESQH